MNLAKPAEYPRWRWAAGVTCPVETGECPPPILEVINQRAWNGRFNPHVPAVRIVHTTPMPIYEFDCSACGHGFERLQKLSDADPTPCPACGRETVKRRVSAPSFRLSGSGWYETDFKGGKDKKRNLAGGDDAPKSGSDTAAKSAESKPEATPAPDAKPSSPTSGTASSGS